MQCKMVGCWLGVRCGFCCFFLRELLDDELQCKKACIAGILHRAEQLQGCQR